jgi:hypothetical protein
MDGLRFNTNAAVQIVSPNVGEKTNLNEAHDMFDSFEHQAARSFYEEVEKHIVRGNSQTSRDTIGWWKNTVEASILTATADTEQSENIRIGAAIKALYSAQLGAAVFYHDKEGNDLLYELTIIDMGADDVLELLASNTFNAATLEIQEDRNIRVILIDQNANKSEYFRKLIPYAKETRHTWGRAEFIGAETRQEASKNYRRILDEGGIQARRQEEDQHSWRSHDRVSERNRRDILAGLRERAERNYEKLTNQMASIDDEFHQAVKQFVKGATDNNCGNFINNVLVPQGIRTKQDLERLASEARFRDRVRAATPIGIGLGFLPAATLGLAFPPEVAKDLRKAIPSNFATSFLTPLLNEMAEKVVGRGQLGPKYLEHAGDRINEKYLMSLCASLPLAQAIGQAADASPLATTIAKLWGGGLGGGAMFGILNHGDREQGIANYQFLDADKPEEAVERIEALKQSYPRAVLGYLRDLGIGMYKDTRNPNEAFDWKKNHIFADILTATRNPHTYAATAALAPNIALGTASGYIKNPAKASAFAYIDDATLALQWMSRKVYQSAGTKLYNAATSLFKRDKSRQTDPEMGLIDFGREHGENGRGITESSSMVPINPVIEPQNCGLNTITGSSSEKPPAVLGAKSVIEQNTAGSSSMVGPPKRTASQEQLEKLRNVEPDVSAVIRM